MAASRISPQRGDRMVPAMLMAIGLHLLFIFGFGFNFEFPQTHSRTTAVTFAMTPSDSAPEDALHTAYHNQLAQDEIDAQADLYPGASLAIAQDDPSAADAAKDANQSNTEDSAAPADESRQPAADSRNPRAGAVAARRSLDAEYLLQWRRRVEQVGNVLYRRATAAYGSGDVRLVVVVAADGTLERVRVMASSGKPDLDQAAVDTVRRAAPFPPFPVSLREQTQRLEIIRTWQFRSPSASAGGA